MFAEKLDWSHSHLGLKEEGLGHLEVFTENSERTQGVSHVYTQSAVCEYFFQRLPWLLPNSPRL